MRRVQAKFENPKLWQSGHQPAEEHRLLEVVLETADDDFIIGPEDSASVASGETSPVVVAEETPAATCPKG